MMKNRLLNYTVYRYFCIKNLKYKDQCVTTCVTIWCSKQKLKDSCNNEHILVFSYQNC